MSAVASSRLPVGSSASTSAGRLASARATATRCCSPPDSWSGKLCSLVERPTRRSVAGRDLSEITRKKVPFYRRNIGIVFQDFKLLPDRTVHDNVAYALQVTGQSRKEIRAKVPDILRLTGLATKLHSFPDQLSGGEQQRVAVARAFVNHPPLLLADEPTGNLDPETSVGIMQLLYRINRTGTTVVVATHDATMVDRMRRRVLELDKGMLIRDENNASYAPRDMNTAEFGALLREPAPAPRRKSVTDDIDDIFS